MRLWKDLSIAKKLYSGFILFVVLLVTGLVCISFALKTLSAVRALTTGESLWSKAQKDALQSLQKYVITGDQKFLNQFHEFIRVPLGDHQARIELAKENPDYQKITDGFLQGKIHPQDIPGIISLLTRFSQIHYIQSALHYWTQGDEMMFELIDLSQSLSQEMLRHSGTSPLALYAILEEISSLNERFTVVEEAFSHVLGEGSRWVENLLIAVLTVTVSLTALFYITVTLFFTRGLSRDLNILNEVAIKVGTGDYSQMVPICSKDELGILARSINRMIENLRKQSQQRRHAEQASLIKNLFLANMSHEIRTPLNAILGFSELLRDRHLQETERNQYLDIIKKTGANLATIINDILDVTKIEAGQLTVEKTIFSLRALLSELEFILKKRCEEKRIELKMEAEGDVSDYIESDPSRLRQILLNVVGNAIKFTDFGHVHLTYQVAGDHLRFFVQDTGPGISEQHQSLLFQAFEQGDSSVQKKYGGTGLGLLLSKKLAQLLGGDVQLARSEPGQGSLFMIELEYRPCVKEISRCSESTDVLRSDIESLQGKHILVVEDSIDSQLLLKLYLQKSGAEVDVASDGQEALDKNQRYRFDLILMDMQMPVMDGYTAVQKMRQRGCALPIIALTAYSMVGDREKTLNAGCTDYLSKPVDKIELLKIVTRYIEKPQSAVVLEVN